MTAAKRQENSEGKERSPRVKTLRRIFGAAKFLGLDEEQVRDLCEQLSGQRRLSKLDSRTLGELARDLSDKSGRKSPRPARRPGAGEEIVSPAQQKLIEDLWIQMAGHKGLFAKKEYQAGFIKRIIGANWPQKKWQAGKVIEAQKRKLKELARLGAAAPLRRDDRDRRAPTEGER